jgi:hypothetical protein
MRKKIERKRFQLALPVSLIDKLEAIQESFGFSTSTETIQHCIISVFRDEIDNYKNRIAQPREKLTPEEKVERKMQEDQALRDAEKKVLHDNASRICSLLEGEIIETNGLYACKFDTYEVVNDNYATKGNLVIPFESLKEKHITNQVKPIGTPKQTALRILKEMASTNQI